MYVISRKHDVGIQFKCTFGCTYTPDRMTRSFHSLAQINSKISPRFSVEYHVEQLTS